MQNTKDFIKQLFLDAGHNPGNSEVEHVLAKVHPEIVSQVDILLGKLPADQYKVLSEGGHLDNSIDDKLIDFVWEIFEFWAGVKE